MNPNDPIAKNYSSNAKNYISEKNEYEKRKNFSSREVGLNHPDNSSFIRLTDSGDIEIFAAPGVGIVISGSTRSISLFADNIRMHTKENGLKWNSMDFNHSADDFTEPTLLKSNPDQYNPAYINIGKYIDQLIKINEEEQQEVKPTITIGGEYQFVDTTADLTGNYGFLSGNESSSLFTEDQISIIKISWETNIATVNNNISLGEFTDYVANLMQSGYTFNQARDKALRDKIG
jgi:hypothetical protein